MNPKGERGDRGADEEPAKHQRRSPESHRTGRVLKDPQTIVQPPDPGTLWLSSQLSGQGWQDGAETGGAHRPGLGGLAESQVLRRQSCRGQTRDTC